MWYSKRLPDDLQVSALHGVLAAAEGAIDLTVSNPTQCGFQYPTDAVRRALWQDEALTYVPAPCGLLSARQAVADYVAAQTRVSSEPSLRADRVVLTASTSEAYGMLFKLLCDPGDAVAVSAPSYPLVEHLAELEGLRTVPYRWAPDGRGFALDLDSLAQALRQAARIVVVVSPNNPTGSVLSPSECVAVRQLCVAYDVPLLVDEVFAPYFRAGGRSPCLVSDDPSAGPLTFVCDGLSKGAGLPQLKLGWIAVYGPDHAANRALQALSWIADAYLSVAAPVQLALPELLSVVAPVMQLQIEGRVRQNLSELIEALQVCPAVDVLNAPGGWYAVLRTPRIMSDEQWVTTLAVDGGVRVHPGFFYDFHTEGYMIVSLIAPTDRFAEGVVRLAEHLCGCVGVF